MSPAAHRDPASGLGLPAPKTPKRDLSAFQMIRAVRANTIETWAESAYRELTHHRRMLGRDYFIFSDPEDIDELLIDHLERYEKDTVVLRLFEPWIGRGLLLADGVGWRRQRRTMAPVFEPGRLDDFVSRIHAEAEKAISGWDRTGPLNDINLLQAFRRLALSVSVRVMFSIEDDGWTAELADIASAARGRASWLTWRDHLAMAGWTTAPQHPDRRAVRQRWLDWAGGLLDRRQANGGLEEPRDLLALLKAARDAETGEHASRTEIIDQLGAMALTAGQDITMALFWSALLLALFPAHQEEVRAELCGSDARSPPDPKVLRSSVAPQAFLYEALRLYPPAYILLVRRAVVDDRIGGANVPRGSAVTVAPWLVHRHEKLWDEPLRFSPARFVRDGRVFAPKQWIPFGVGPRICLGMSFALTEILVVLRVLLARYRIGLARDTRLPRPVGRTVLLPEFEPSFELAPL